MTNQEILTKAIEKAIAGGWKQNLISIHGNIKNPDKVFLRQLDISGTHIYWAYDEYISVPELIFNHNFAKALWGEEDNRADGGTFSPQGFVKQALWKSRLQEMVMAEDPIKYLGEKLNG